jgi:hypothetical protein
MLVPGRPGSLQLKIARVHLIAAILPEKWNVLLRCLQVL